MKPKAIMKIVTDFCMTVLLMLLMAFELIGRTAHEWIGAGMFVLFILHHIFNIKWSRNLTKGIYSPFRIVQTCLAVLVLLSMLGSILSSIFISREVFSFLPITGGRRFGRTLHMLSAYWGFIFLSLHLGIHWSTMMGLVRKKFSGKSMVRSAITITEYEILLYLFQNPNRVLTYSQIYERVWREPDYGEARKLVSHHVQAIRRKLKLKEEAAICLRCVREVGYSLRME